MKKILFQGDSITDSSRGSEENSFNLGHGYPSMVAGRIGNSYPGEYSFVNRGVSGNRIVDVYARIKQDIINLKPDIMSLLIGANDVWHELEAQNGVSSRKFGMLYDLLIKEIREELPDLKLIILTPFALCGSGTEKYFDRFKSEIALRENEAIKAAQKHNLPCIRLQPLFDDAMKRYDDASYWTLDGVHPMAPGHSIIAEAWIKCFKDYILS